MDSTNRKPTIHPPRTLSLLFLPPSHSVIPVLPVLCLDRSLAQSSYSVFRATVSVHQGGDNTKLLRTDVRTNIRKRFIGAMGLDPFLFLYQVTGRPSYRVFLDTKYFAKSSSSSFCPTLPAPWFPGHRPRRDSPETEPGFFRRCNCVNCAKLFLPFHLFLQRMQFVEMQQHAGTPPLPASPVSAPRN